MFYRGGTASILIIGYISSLVFGEPKGEKLFLAYNSIITFPASIYLFMTFRNIEIKNNIVKKLCVSLGSLCFGAYLLTDHPLIREPLWKMINLPQYKNHCIFILFVFVAITIIILFTAGCVVEKFRQIIFDKVKVNKIYEFIDNKMICVKNYINKHII